MRPVILVGVARATLAVAARNESAPMMQGMMSLMGDHRTQGGIEGQKLQQDRGAGTRRPENEHGGNHGFASNLGVLLPKINESQSSLEVS